MTNVSTQKLREKALLALHENFNDIILSQKGNRAGKQLLTNFFTEAEGIMFAKRLAIIVAIASGHSRYEVAKKYGSSRTTVTMHYKKLLGGHYDVIVPICKKKSFDWSKIEWFFDMPPIAGNRWEWFDKRHGFGKYSK